MQSKHPYEVCNPELENSQDHNPPIQACTKHYYSRNKPVCFRANFVPALIYNVKETNEYVQGFSSIVYNGSNYGNDCEPGGE